MGFPAARTWHKTCFLGDADAGESLLRMSMNYPSCNVRKVEDANSQLYRGRVWCVYRQLHVDGLIELRPRHAGAKSEPSPRCHPGCPDPKQCSSDAPRTTA